jgi:hypothetical protein
MLFLPEIGKHTFAQILSFAHVKDFACGVFHKIDTRA